MKFRKILSGILVAAISCTAVFCVGQSRNVKDTAKVTAAEDAVKIMALGDSITDGYFGADGYRKYFYHYMTELGYDIDMVGSKDYGSWRPTYTDSNGVTFDYDGDHSGYSGYAIQYMTGTETRQGILETIQETDMIAACNPDIVLLQIGTNDILSAYNDGIIDRLENLVNVILEDMTDPDDVVFVSTIPYIDVVTRYDWFNSYGDIKWNNTQEAFAEIIKGYVDSYNTQIKQLVTEMQTQGKSVKFADINSVIDPLTDLQDGCHPNETGYEKMGTYWTNLVDSYLSDEPVTTTVTAEPIVTTTTETSAESTVTTETTVSETTLTTDSEVTTAPITVPTEATTYVIYESEGAISLNSPPDKTSYIIGEELDLTGLSVSLDYYYGADGHDVIYDSVSPLDYPEAFIVDTSDFDNSKAGTYTIKISCTDAVRDTYRVIDNEVSFEVTVQNTYQYEKGDVNTDGTVDVSDVVKLQKYLVKKESILPEQSYYADMDENDKVNIFDCILLKRLLMLTE